MANAKLCPVSASFHAAEVPAFRLRRSKRTAKIAWQAHCARENCKGGRANAIRAYQSRNTLGHGNVSSGTEPESFFKKK
jgi:hypothetical protein